MPGYVGVPGVVLPYGRWGRTDAQGSQPVAAPGRLLTQTLTTEGGAYVADATGKKPITPAVVVRRGTVTITASVATGTGSNSIVVFRNGRQGGAPTAIPSGGSFTNSITARDNDVVQGYMLNSVGASLSLNTTGNSIAWKGEPKGRSVTIPIAAGTYAVPAVAPLIVPLTPAVRCAQGNASVLLQVASGTGSNTVAIYVNGVSVKTLAVGSTGPFPMFWPCASGDIVQFFNTNIATGGMTLTASTFTYYRA